MSFTKGETPMTARGAEKASTPIYSAPWSSREIHKDGRPFVRIQRDERPDHYTNPTDVDDFSRLVLESVNQHAALLAEVERLRAALGACVERLVVVDRDNLPWTEQARAALAQKGVQS